jgi:hypothetical protein
MKRTEEVFWTQELQWAINDIQDGVEGAVITDEISRYWLQQTRNRKPDADDRKEAALLAKQGYENSFIGLALELNPERVVEALA